MEAMTTLRGDLVTLRPATDDDVPALVEIRATPEVRRWWGEEDDFTAAVAEDVPQTYCILADDRVVGAIQWYEGDDPITGTPAWTSTSTPRWHGRGWAPTPSGRWPAT